MTECWLRMETWVEAFPVVWLVVKVKKVKLGLTGHQNLVFNSQFEMKSINCIFFIIICASNFYNLKTCRSQKYTSHSIKTPWSSLDYFLSSSMSSLSPHPYRAPSEKKCGRISRSTRRCEALAPLYFINHSSCTSFIIHSTNPFRTLFFRIEPTICLSVHLSTICLDVSNSPVQMGDISLDAHDHSGGRKTLITLAVVALVV